MHIVFVSQYFTPEAGATSELLSGIAREIAARGHTVEGLAGQPSYFGATRLPKVLHDGPLSVRRVWSTQLARQSTIGRVLNTATFSASMFWHLTTSRRKDELMVVVTNPPVLPWVCAAAAMVRGGRYVVVVHDVYPDIAVELGALRRGGVIERLWRGLNRWTLRRAGAVIVLGRDMLELLRRDYGDALGAVPLRVIGNWADGRSIRPIDRVDHSDLQDAQARSRFIVQYSGNIGRFHEVETIVRAAEHLDTTGRFRFDFVGEGQQRDHVAAAAAQLPKGSIVMKSYQPRELLGRSLTACDAGLVTLRAGLSGMAVPSKLYGILAAGKPVVVVGPADCEAARLVREKACGVVVGPGDARGLSAALEQLAADPGLCAAMGRRAREAFEADYELRRVADDWLEVLSAVDAPAAAPLPTAQINT